MVRNISPTRLWLGMSNRLHLQAPLNARDGCPCIYLAGYNWFHPYQFSSPATWTSSRVTPILITGRVGRRPINDWCLVFRWRYSKKDAVNWFLAYAMKVLFSRLIFDSPENSHREFKQLQVPHSSLSNGSPLLSPVHDKRKCYSSLLEAKMNCSESLPSCFS
jgi:hypothetical protein